MQIDTNPQNDGTCSLTIHNVTPYDEAYIKYNVSQMNATLMKKKFNRTKKQPLFAKASFSKFLTEHNIARFE